MESSLAEAFFPRAGKHAAGAGGFPNGSLRYFSANAQSETSLARTGCATGIDAGGTV